MVESLDFGLGTTAPRTPWTETRLNKAGTRREQGRVMCELATISHILYTCEVVHKVHTKTVRVPKHKDGRHLLSHTKERKYTDTAFLRPPPPSVPPATHLSLPTHPVSPQHQHLRCQPRLRPPCRYPLPFDAQQTNKQTHKEEEEGKRGSETKRKVVKSFSIKLPSWILAVPRPHGSSWGRRGMTHSS